MNENIKDEIRTLLGDLESDRIERTISTTNTDKFGQTICAFANDLPNHQMPGFLFLGVLDNGVIQGVDATDALLKNVAAIRTDGNIQPQPTMTVEKIEMDEGDIVMVKVEPSQFPPVRYKGRIWIRTGPRRGVANENDEHILMEKRRANVKAFDASPCLNATIDDLDLRLFKHYFLPKAMSDEELEVEHTTDIKNSLSKFYELQDLFAKFVIVAAQTRKEEFLDKLNASIFKSIQERVIFWNYENVVKQHEGLKAVRSSCL